MNIIGNAREKIGISQSELARRCNLSANHISRIERNLKTPSNDAIKKISKALGLCPIALYIFFYLNDECEYFKNKDTFCSECEYCKKESKNQS